MSPGKSSSKAAISSVAAGFQLDPSLSGLSDALLKAKYDGADLDERKRLGFVRRATPREFADANESHGAPADFGGPVFTSSTPPVVSDDTDSGIPVTPMPTGVSFQKQNADGRLPLNTSRPRAAEFAQPGLQTVGATMGSQPFTDAQLADGTTLRFQGQLGADELRAKVHGYRTKQGASQIAANPPSGVTGPARQDKPGLDMSYSTWAGDIPSSQLEKGRALASQAYGEPSRGRVYSNDLDNPQQKYVPPTPEEDEASGAMAGGALATPFMGPGAGLLARMAIMGAGSGVGSGAAQLARTGRVDPLNTAEDVAGGAASELGGTLVSGALRNTGRLARSVWAGGKAAAGEMPIVGKPVKSGLKAAMDAWNPEAIEQEVLPPSTDQAPGRPYQPNPRFQRGTAPIPPRSGLALPSGPPERVPLWKQMGTMDPENSPSSRLVQDMSGQPAETVTQPGGEDFIEQARRGAPDDIANEVRQVRQANIDRRIQYGSPDERMRGVQQNADLAAPEVQDKGWQRANDLQKRKMSQPRNEGPAPTETRKNLAQTPEDFLAARQGQRVNSGAPAATPPADSSFEQIRQRLAELMQQGPPAEAAPPEDLTQILRQSLAEKMGAASAPGPNDDILQAMRNGTYNWKRTPR